MDLKNIKYLHVIRGFAAFFVLLAHAKWPFWVGGAAYLSGRNFSSLALIDKIGLLLALSTSNGTAMVIVFFVLSGFMIAHSYQKNQWQYKEFLINRALRIYTPYIASVLLAGGLLVLSYSLAQPLFETPLKDYHSDVAKAYHNGLNLQNFGLTLVFYRSGANYYGFNYVYWSLLYEMIFYLLFPLLLRHIRIVFIVAVILYPIHFFFDKDEMVWFPIYFLIKFLLYFAAGVGLYQLIRNNQLKAERYFFLRRRWLQWLILGCFTSIVVTGFTLPKGVSFLFATLMAVLWICYLLQYGIHKTLLNKIMLFLGEISYSLYLVHVPLLLLLYSLIYRVFNFSRYNSPWTYLIFVLLVLPVAYGFYLLFEKFSFTLIQKHKKAVHAPLPAKEPIEPSKEI